jgi:pyruvate/2-oxoglutarate dehydrogenase complex dihydrolipoamide dehydrogenase (E3) component
MSSDLEFDFVVLGGGSAGYAGARTALSLGMRTAVIDGAAELGGLCILRGCMPTKALLHAADVLHLAHKASTWGLQVEKPGFEFPAVMRRKTAMVEEFASYRRNQLNSGKFPLFREQATFTDPYTVQLSSGRKIRGKNFLIATGSEVSPPPFPELAEVGYLTSDSALELQKLPESMIVLGGGAVAVEFAQFFQRFGVKVTLIQRSSEILRDFDCDAAQVLRQVLIREGMEVVSNTRLVGAAAENGQKVIFYEKDGERRSARAQEIFYALGRRPNTARLNLPAAGVHTEYSQIVCGPTMQTSVRHIFAAGDCAGPYEIVHIAIQQGEVAAFNAAHPDKPRSMDYRVLISVVFTDPQVATVGLTEKEAAARGVSVVTASYPFADHGKSIIMDAMDGFVKLLADPITGEILGGSCVGPSGGELIHEIVVAVSKRMTVHELAVLPHYHPTLAEIWTYPAEELAEKCRS